MPLTKKPSSLQDLCLQNISENLKMHTLSYLRTKSEISLYLPLRRRFSNQMLKLLLTSKDKFQLETKFSPLYRLFQDWENGDEPSRCCLELVFNPYLTTVLAPPESECCGFDLPVELFLKLLYNCKNITTLDLNHFDALDDELLLPIVENSLQNVVHLVIACTYVGDETVSAIMRYCPLLTHLDLSGTSITDEGLKMLCGNYLNAKQNEEVLPCFCPNPMNCSVRPKLKYFDITCRAVTNTGLMWILHHFDSLENLEYKIPSFHDGVSQALSFLQQQTGTSYYKTNLKKITFFFLDEVENKPEKVLLLCPKLEILIAREPFYNWQFSHIANCEYVTDVTLCVKNISTLESMEFQSFLLLRGHKLTSFELRGPLSIRAASLLNILCHFPKLHKLHFCDLKLLPPIDYYLSNDKHVADFKDLLSMDKLETFIISSTYGYKSAVSGLVAHIISITHNLKFLEIAYSRVNDKAFSPVETCNALYNLRELKLHSCNITKKFLWKFIKGDNQLETLKIEDCDRITLKILRKMQKYVAKNNFIIETYNE